MCWSEFLLIIGFIVLIIAITLFFVIGFTIPVVVFSCKVWDMIYRAIAWPFRALGRLVSPQKKNKTQHFHFEDDDIDIRF